MVAQVVPNVKLSTLVPVMAKKVAHNATLYTDEFPSYDTMARFGYKHLRIEHSAKVYARGNVHTNTIEGYFSIFKRGMKGVYQHCSKRHLHRYLAEFDFRYSARVALGFDDAERAERALSGIVGQRLTYRPSLAAAT